MQSVYADGTPYTLTATPAKVEFGTTSPAITVIASTGVKLALNARVVVDMAFCTIVTPINLTLKLRKTSGTPGDLANSSTIVKIGQIATSGQGETDLEFTLPEVVYTKAFGNQVIELWASVDVLPASGQLTIREASILVLP